MTATRRRPVRVSDSTLLSTAKKVARRALPDGNSQEIKDLRPLFVGAFIAGYMFAFGVNVPSKKGEKE